MDAENERVLERDCACCGTRMTPAPPGRSRIYCSQVCRQRASELRRAAAQLGRGDLRPEVVRELAEKIVETPVRAAVVDGNGTAREWSTILEQLIATLGYPDSVLVRRDGDHQRLYLRLIDALTALGRVTPGGLDALVSRDSGSFTAA
jgi:hypothetical protein